MFTFFYSGIFDFISVLDDLINVTQKAPTEMPRGMNVKKDENGISSNKEGEEGEVLRERGGALQMWHRNGTRCPKGTVPIRRSRVHDVLRAKSLYDYGKKKQPRIDPLSRRSSDDHDAPDVLSDNGHEVRASRQYYYMDALILLVVVVVSNTHYYPLLIIENNAYRATHTHADLPPAAASLSIINFCLHYIITYCVNFFVQYHF